MRHALIALSILLGTASPAMAQVSVTVAIPGVSIGIHQPVYPDLVQVPGYPVYYAPQARTNYFFYDGLYWVYQDDRWYMSSWYDGPWDLVEPDDVPLFVLRVPVRYYVAPPVYFHGWVVSAPPRWELYWGPRWTRHHHGWDHWDRRVVYAPAPLPVYQRHYHGERYPRREYQRVIRQEHYHYQPRDQVVRRHEQRPAPRPQAHAQPAPQRYGPYPQNEQRPQRDREETRRSEPMQVSPSQRAPLAQEQAQQARQEPERRVESPGRSAQHSPDFQRGQPQREHRERGEARRPEGMQVLPHQRAAVLQERQQQQQQRQEQLRQRQEAPRAQQAPRPPQVQERGAQDRGGDRQPRANPDRRSGSERGGDRGPGRG